jgi:hypothetical protein
MSFFTEKLMNQDVSDHHLFVTNHPYMIEVGLGMFTTGTLYAWWNDVTFDGYYLNRTLFNNTRNKEELSNPDNGIYSVLGITNETEFFWYGWKPNKELQNAGVYKKQDLSDANTGGSNPWSFESAVGVVSVSDLLSESFDATTPIVGGTLNENATSFIKTVARSPNPSLLDIRPLSSLINMNRYMNSFDDFFPRSTWDKDSDTIGGKETNKIFASHELLTEIKSSKFGPYIEWSGELTFYINENNGTLNCSITEWVPFKLYLFDDITSTTANKAVTLKNLTYVAPKRDVNGKVFSSSSDGGYSDFDPDSPSTLGASEIDLSYNGVTKKWESGTPQLFAKLVTDIGLPTVPKVDRLETNDVAEDLDSEEFEESKFIPASGIAMPIRPQNGNPLQWQPNYLDSDDVRCRDATNKKKETIVVYNYNTRRRFKRDEEVLLSRIDGQWHVIPLWAGTDEGDAVVAGVNRWGEFTYMATNSEFFFRTENGARFSPRDAELSFHKLYYQGDSLNENTDYGVSGGYNKEQPFNTVGFIPTQIAHGYFQTTSFDYLDKKLFGIRGVPGSFIGQAGEDLCSISTTSAIKNSAGREIPKPNPQFATRNAAHAGLFFGCFFPEGYNNTTQFIQARNWNIIGSTTGSIVDPSVFFWTQGENYSSYPLRAANATSDRNNCRQPAVADPLEELTENNNSWSRYDDRYSANLFAEQVQNTALTFPQMPADVMLNASPTGENGSPIYSVHRFKNFYNPSADKHLEASRAFLQACWLSKESLSDEDEEENRYTKGDSAFDLLPVNRQSLTFRPLKMEGYVQFGRDANNAAAFEKVKDLSVNTGSHGSRVGFCVEAHRTQKDGKRPCSYFVEDRETQLNSDYFELLYQPDHGLKWGGDLSYKPSYTNLHEFSYWEAENGGALTWTRSLNGNWRGAGAFGVITTFTTVSANSQINFITDNIYGMGAAANGRFSVSAGNTGQDKTWGVASFLDSYRQENIIDLSVRIYQQHPRDQLLYDPRTFAVHHFNPDVRYANNKFVKDDGTVEDFNRETENVELSGRDENGNPITFFYSSTKTFSTVDFREISRYETDSHEDGENYQSVVLTTGEYVLLDACYNGQFLPAVINNQRFWHVNSNRVGKLLPYKYGRLTVGVSFEENEVINFSNGDRVIDSASLNDTPVENLLNKIVIKNAGNSYAVGDVVGSSSLQISFEVTATGVGGSVAGLKCISPGVITNFSSFAAKQDVFGPNSSGQITIRTIDTAAGEDFEAYFVAGRVYSKVYVDSKPYLMKRDGQEIVRIAAPEPQGTHLTTGFTPAAENGAFIDKSHEVLYILDQTLLSENRQYDVFFHFHNDISMTWLASNSDFHGDFRNITECAEQHVTVRINPR